MSDSICVCPDLVIFHLCIRVSYQVFLEDHHTLILYSLMYESLKDVLKRTINFTAAMMKTKDILRTRLHE